MYGDPTCRDCIANSSGHCVRHPFGGVQSTATPSKPEWEDDVMEAFRESTPDRILDIVRSLLSSHRRSLAEEVGKLKLDVPSADDDSAYPLIVEARNEIIDAVLTIINRDI